MVLFYVQFCWISGPFVCEAWCSAASWKERVGLFAPNFVAIVLFFEAIAIDARDGMLLMIVTPPWLLIL